MAQFADIQMSYADCIGAATAEELAVSAVLGLDHDFRILGYVLEP